MLSKKYFSGSSELISTCSVQVSQSGYNLPGSISHINIFLMTELCYRLLLLFNYQK